MASQASVELHTLIYFRKRYPPPQHTHTTTTTTLSLSLSLSLSFIAAVFSCGINEARIVKIRANGFIVFVPKISPSHNHFISQFTSSFMDNLYYWKSKVVSGSFCHFFKYGIEGPVYLTPRGEKGGDWFVDEEHQKVKKMDGSISYRWLEFTWRLYVEPQPAIELPRQLSQREVFLDGVSSFCSHKDTNVYHQPIYVQSTINLCVLFIGLLLGDVTCLATVPIDMKVEAHFFVKEDDIIARISLAEMIFTEVDPSLEVECFKKDGDYVSKWTQFAKVSEVTSKQCEDPASILPELHWGEIASSDTHSNYVLEQSNNYVQVGASTKDAPQVESSVAKRGYILIDINDRFPRDFLSDIFSKERLTEES
ncbi:hypothetical protein IFM89_010930 [Coptis chinensis]|uniref:Quinolinate phosphoribosyl transferase N-terminal domain-containing protein n=1 Tax=Coptis chinensis TaxID=261450 RepID=A0A835IJN3_9MAGN|nr:hypothetical protein IFM89_010930 [Coptis chinensis]